MHLHELLWGERGYAQALLNQDTTASHEAALLELQKIRPSDTIPGDLIEQIWLLPLLETVTRRRTPLSTRVQQLLGQDAAIRPEDHDKAIASCPEYAAYARTWDPHSLWQLKSTEPDPYAAFARDLDSLPGRRESWQPGAAHALTRIPSGMWYNGPQDARQRQQIYQTVMPALARVLGEPAPDALTRLYALQLQTADHPVSSYS